VAVARSVQGVAKHGRGPKVLAALLLPHERLAVHEYAHGVVSLALEYDPRIVVEPVVMLVYCKEGCCVKGGGDEEGELWAGN
jgi:hypothetical protein